MRPARRSAATTLLTDNLAAATGVEATASTARASGLAIPSANRPIKTVRTLADYTAAKFPRDAEQIEHSHRLIAASSVKIGYGTDCGTFPFPHGNLEFQAMVAAGINPARALRAATATAAELLGRKDIGVLEPGRVADIVAMPGDPIADIGRTAEVDFVMRSGHLHRIPDDSSAAAHR
jgi:imidazolonepropionase-like amidohydrolase